MDLFQGRGTLGHRSSSLIKKTSGTLDENRSSSLIKKSIELERKKAQRNLVGKDSFIYLLVTMEPLAIFYSPFQNSQLLSTCNCCYPNCQALPNTIIPSSYDYKFISEIHKSEFKF